MYVNEFGVVVEVDANSSTQAFANSDDIANHSGVMLIDSASDQAVVGEDVSGIKN